MNIQEFENSVEQGHLRSKKVLLKKADEYAFMEMDRLTQFKKVATITNETPESACVGFAVKHFSSICDMAIEPKQFSLKQWREKITDLRNYTHLLDALIEEELEE
jgi:hypothetical protein